MGHGHSHDHSHEHGHQHTSSHIGVAFWLNTAFAIIELVGGFLTNSVAILSDALHDFGDSLSLGVSWYFQRKAKQKRDTIYTYGYRRFSLLGAIINAAVLLAGSVLVISESLGRLVSPEQPDARGMILLAVLGILVNGAAMLRLRKGNSLNERVISLHFVEDVLGWVAVLVGAVIMLFADLPVLDPILSMGIAAYILFNVYRNMRAAFRIILQAVPERISEKEIKELLSDITQIKDMHDLHLWTMDGNYNVLTMHVVVAETLTLTEAETLKAKIKAKLHEAKIDHATLELEISQAHCDQEEC